VCSSCKKELILSPSATRFPAFCANYAKEHAFLKKDGKFLLLPTNKVVNSEKADIKNTNGRPESASKIEDREKKLFPLRIIHILRELSTVLH
jgi:hypothetical protein